MTPYTFEAYRMALQGYGWEDIQMKLGLGERRHQHIWDIVCRANRPTTSLKEGMQWMRKT